MAFSDNEIVKLVTNFSIYFNENKIPYVLIGGLAVNLWGRIRTTLDADFIIDQNKLDIDEFVKYLLNKGYQISSEEFLLGFKEKTNITIWSGLFRIDMKGIYNNFAKKTIEMAVTIPLFDLEIKVNSPELLIVSKLCYGSEQDFEDAASIYLRLFEQNKLKITYIENYCKKLQIQDRLRLLITLTKENITESSLEQLIDNLEALDDNIFDRF